MLDKNELLLKYFFLCGIPEDIKNKYKTNELKEMNNLSPILLSSYSAEGKTELFEICKNLLNEDIYLQNNVFPKKADFLSDVIFDSNILEPPTLKLKTNLFNQYICKVSSFKESPEPFYHCFQYIFKIDENSFAVLVGDVAGHGVGAAVIMAMAKNKKNHFRIESSVIILSLEKT